jgi:hypothetical protein
MSLFQERRHLAVAAHGKHNTIGAMLSKVTMRVASGFGGTCMRQKQMSNPHARPHARHRPEREAHSSRLQKQVDS